MKAFVSKYINTRAIIYVALVFIVAAVAYANVREFLPRDAYPCDVTRVIDGDTFECEALLSRFFKLKKDITIRLAGVDCPEVRGSEKVQGNVVKLKVIALIGNRTIIIDNLEKDKFGRTVATVAVPKLLNNSETYDLSNKLIEDGSCKPYNK